VTYALAFFVDVPGYHPFGPGAFQQLYLGFPFLQESRVHLFRFHELGFITGRVEQLFKKRQRFRKAFYRDADVFYF